MPSGRLNFGAKNWLFIGRDETGWRSAIVYTMVEQVRRHGRDPFAYFEWVFEKLMSIQPKKTTQANSSRVDLKHKTYQSAYSKTQRRSQRLNISSTSAMVLCLALTALTVERADGRLHSPKDPFPGDLIPCEARSGSRTPGNGAALRTSCARGPARLVRGAFHFP